MKIIVILVTLIILINCEYDTWKEECDGLCQLTIKLLGWPPNMNCTSAPYACNGDYGWNAVVTCANSSIETITEIDLSRLSLKGSLPPDIGKFKNLNSLTIGPHISGEIPSQVGSLTYLNQLKIKSSTIDGLIPSWIGNLPLELLTISPSIEKATLPTEIGLLTNLYFINIEGNYEGTIPTEIGLMNLRYLTIVDTQLSGTIPYEISQCTELITITISNNDALSGTIPWEIGCALSNLQILQIVNNKILDGSIPPQLGMLTNLQILALDGNNLSTTIPQELGFNPDRFDRDYLWCYTDNPAMYYNTSGLTMIFISNTNLIGTIPSQLGELRLIQSMDFSKNKLNSTIPSDLGKLYNMKYIDLSMNNLIGTIPPQIGQPPLLTLKLFSNALNGTIPKQMVDSGKLKEIALQNNKLVGTIPPELSKLSIIASLDLTNNLLSGTIPVEFCNVYFYSLKIAGNNIYGCWYNCTNMTHFVNKYQCNASGCQFGCDSCAPPSVCNSGVPCNPLYNWTMVLPSNSSMPSGSNIPSVPSTKSPSSLTIFIAKQLYLRKKITSLYSYLSNLTLPDGEELRIHQYVDLHLSTLLLLGNIYSGQGWNTSGSTIIIGYNTTTTIDGNWSDSSSYIVSEGSIVVTNIALSKTRISFKNSYILADGLIGYGVILTINGGTYILTNNSALTNAVVQIGANSRLSLRGLLSLDSNHFYMTLSSTLDINDTCADLSNSKLTITDITPDNFGKNYTIAYVSPNCSKVFELVDSDVGFCKKAQISLYKVENTILVSIGGIYQGDCTSIVPTAVGATFAIVIFIGGLIFIYAVHKVPSLRKRFLPFRDRKNYFINNN